MCDKHVSPIFIAAVALVLFGCVLYTLWDCGILTCGKRKIR